VRAKQVILATGAHERPMVFGNNDLPGVMLSSALADYAALAGKFPPGSPVGFAYQLGREYGLTGKLMDRIIERVSVLPADASLYDIQQVFTELANGSVNYKTMIKLQHLSGDLAFNTDAVTHRCGTCERLLPE
jgi:hypothetical protein